MKNYTSIHTFYDDFVFSIIADWFYLQSLSFWI